MRGRVRTAGERGSVLALVPAGFLVLVLLGALAVDSAVAYRGQQELHDTLAAAANDAAAAGLDDASFYTGRLVLDPSAVERAVCQSVEAQTGAGLSDISVAMSISGMWLRVEGSARVPVVFGRRLPGLGDRSVRASAEAVLSTAGIAGRAPPAFGPAAPITCA